MPPHERPRRRRLLTFVLVGAIVLPLVYLGATFLQVWWASNTDDAGPVDAIVVLGAAQYDGRPSPVLEARLTHALDLYAAGMAPIIVTTGSKQPGDRFTEAFVQFTWLREAGVPEEDVLVVTDGTNTFEQLTATASVLNDAGFGDHVLLVSDPYHHLRASEIGREVGLEPDFSPADVPSTRRQLLRETAGVSLGRIIGFRRVSNLSQTAEG